MLSLIETLMERDDMTRMDAMQLVGEARADLHENLDQAGFDVDEFMSDWFGLEPDYFEEVL